MNPLALLFVAVELSDSDEREITLIARDLLPDCWEVTRANDSIRLQHGHKTPCNEGREGTTYDETFTWETLAYQLVNDFGPDAVLAARTRVSVTPNPTTYQALRA